MENVNKLARRAAMHDWREGRAARAAWWVTALSYDLGIVDSHGMIDVAGEVARHFLAQYARVYRGESIAPGWHPNTVG